MKKLQFDRVILRPGWNLPYKEQYTLSYESKLAQMYSNTPHLHMEQLKNMNTE